MQLIRTVRIGLLAASSIAVIGIAAPAAASESDAPTPRIDRPDFAIDRPEIVIRDGYDPNAFPPDGILDPVNITGVGQVVTDQGGGFVGTCTGTLINPRTVIFAAHCVNTRPADAYGAATGGTGISVGFQQNNLPGLLNWLGINDPSQLYQTDEATAIYNVEHVWYDERSLVGGFLQADIALATLDTHASDIPTWAMLFTPLDSQEHVTITGYGSTGTPSSVLDGGLISGGFRRRVAENYVSFLGSLADRNLFLFGDASGSLPQNLYMAAFSDPNPAFDPAARKFDFGLFGDNDVALPREGTTAPGDSGGPLIVDEAFDVPVIIGVLSGGSRFFAGQPFSTYGTHNFYQPLHAFWDVIVANNPYVYATNKFGIGDWTDADHWIQTMDPNYQIALDGTLVNGLPSTPGAGVSGEGAKFGDVCFLDDCQEFSQAPAVTTGGRPYYVEGGPGTEDFVPDNQVADPSQGIRPRYFDVTLSAAGVTRLRRADITIDRLTIDGATKLDIAGNGSLDVLGDFTQIVGWTNIDGEMSAGETFILSGLVTGSGTLRTPWFTSVAGIIAPGDGLRTGTLTIDGNVVLASESTLLIDVNRRGSDRLAVSGLLSLSDPDDVSTGAGLVFSRAVGVQPRHGQTFTIATARAGIEGEFGSVDSFLGILRPELTYGENAVTATMRAGSIWDFLRGLGDTAERFGEALDLLRDGSYDSLYGLYGAIDLMDRETLAATLDSLAPRVGGTYSRLQQRQSRALFSAVSDRLSLAGSHGDRTLSVVGAPGLLSQSLAGHGGAQSPALGFAGLAPSTERQMMLPEGMSGFVSSGFIGGLAGDSSHFSQGGEQSTYFGSGLERQIAENLAVGFAFGYADGLAQTSDGETRTETRQVAAYGSYYLGGGAYVGAIASYDAVDSRANRLTIGGTSFGATETQKLTATLETGVNLAVTRGLTFTPRAQLAYGSEAMAGFEEYGAETALKVDDLRTDRLEARLGAKLAGQERLGGGWSLVPEVKADYVSLMSGSDQMLTVRFGAADSVPIVLPYAHGDSSWGELQGAVKLHNGAFSFGAGFETSVGRDELRDDRAMLDVGLRF